MGQVELRLTKVRQFKRISYIFFNNVYVLCDSILNRQMAAATTENSGNTYFTKKTSIFNRNKAYFCIFLIEKLLFVSYLPYFSDKQIAIYKYAVTKMNTK